MEALSWQIRAVLASIAAGLLMGAFYDVCAFVRRMFCAGRLLTALVDLFYWLSASAATFAIIMKANRGEMRFSILGGVAVGLWIYTFTGRLLVAPILTIIEWAARRMVRSCRRGWRMARRPIVKTRSRIRNLFMQGFSAARRTVFQAGKPESSGEAVDAGQRQASRGVNE